MPNMTRTFSVFSTALTIVTVLYTYRILVVHYYTKDLLLDNKAVVVL